MKKLIALLLTIALLMGLAIAPASAESKGKILWLSNLNSGIQYEFYVAYWKMIAENLGYTFDVVYGDMSNDPAGNLKQVKNAYTSDVKGIIISMDGGVVNIMDEYPDLWVVGFFSDMDSVFEENGPSHDVMNREKFLGNMGDNYISGKALGEAYAQEVIARGYKKVATCIFPVFAYPKHTVADASFRAAIAAYNETAAEPIEIVGDAEVLAFQPMSDSYFLEQGRDELECIVGFCAGTTFIYPKMVEAKAMGFCREDLQLITGGFDNDPDLLADCGDDKNIVSLTIQGVESAIWPIAMLDAAISGAMYKDYPGKERMDSSVYIINSSEKFRTMIEKSPLGPTLDLSKAQAQWDDMKNYFTSVNPDASYADLTKYCQSFTVEGYMK